MVSCVHSIMIHPPLHIAVWQCVPVIPALLRQRPGECSKHRPQGLLPTGVTEEAVLHCSWLSPTSLTVFLFLKFTPCLYRGQCDVTLPESHRQLVPSQPVVDCTPNQSRITAFPFAVYFQSLVMENTPNVPFSVPQLHVSADGTKDI